MPVKAKNRPGKTRARVTRQKWWVYLLRCADDSLYCGITLDLLRRVAEHNTSPKAARYTRSRRPVCLAWSEVQRTRSKALKREIEIKRLTRRMKEKMLITPAAPIRGERK